MSSWISIVPSVISTIGLLITGAIGYGKLVQKVDSLSKDIDNVRKDVDSPRKKVAELRQYHVSHLENHPI